LLCRKSTHYCAKGMDRLAAPISPDLSVSQLCQRDALGGPRVLLRPPCRTGRTWLGRGRSGKPTSCPRRGFRSARRLRRRPRAAQGGCVRAGPSGAARRTGNLWVIRRRLRNMPGDDRARPRGRRRDRRGSPWSAPGDIRCLPSRFWRVYDVTSGKWAQVKEGKPAVRVVEHAAAKIGVSLAERARRRTATHGAHPSTPKVAHCPQLTRPRTGTGGFRGGKARYYLLGFEPVLGCIDGSMRVNFYRAGPSFSPCR
jgi:hypothetical protein